MEPDPLDPHQVPSLKQRGFISGRHSFSHLCSLVLKGRGFSRAITSSLKKRGFSPRGNASTFLITLLGTSFLHAQTPSPTYTLHTNTNLVILDVTVTDANHNPVHNLKATDFTVLEDNQPQHIRSFDEHAPSTTPAKPIALPKLEPGIFTDFAPAPATGPVNILLLDTLNTPLRDQSFVRTQLLDYLKKVTPGTQIAIFGLSRQLTILQGFTSNPELLRAVLSKKHAEASSLLDDPNGGGGGDNASATSTSDAVASLGNDPNIQQLLANVQQFEAQNESFQLQLRSQYTLDAMNELARYLVSIPGRKNLIWFSGSFPLNVMPNGDLTNSFAATVSSEEEYRETVNLLTRSQVAVYPVDARGLLTSPVYSVANSGAKYARSPQAAGKDELAFAQQHAQENATMLQMAGDTGGQAYLNTNGLAEAVAKAIDAGANYYTLTYSPANLKLDGLFRKISVELQQKGLTLSYRRGYYSELPNRPGSSDSKPEQTAATQHRATTIERVMLRGAPTPTQLLFTTRVLPASTTTEPQPAPGNVLTVDGEKLKGPYRRYAVDIVADAHSLEFTASPDGLHHAAVEFITAVYAPDGTLIGTNGSTIHADLSPANYPRYLQTPLVFSQNVSVPAKGEYFLRIAIHDQTSDRAGAIEIPITAVKDLSPLPPH